jgi:uncharacterized protein YndB with AHSA1/START domain
MGEIRRSVDYDDAPDAVWQALTDRALLAEWLMPNDFEPVVGRAFQLRAPKMPGWDGVIHCRVLELDPPRLMRWSWQGTNMAAETIVSFHLAPSAQGTTLTLEHTGFRGVGGMILRLMHDAGWRGKFLDKQLRAVLARRKDAR